ncbi:MAG: class I SAM-dependent methyltransferase [Proteobacteria bacterium]|nr:class I SAM-dependent methyltransferase [Pseudomonadota bacterium]
MHSPSFHCRACDSGQATELLDLGALPLGNAFVARAADTDDDFRPPLTLVMCADCGLIQLAAPIDRALLFTHYLWVTGTSASAMRHAQWLATRLAARTSPSQPSFLVEIASNDGSFLRHYRAAGFDILGVDPSDVGAKADAAGLPTMRAFFGAAAARDIVTRHRHADVIVARNVLGHSSELRDLMDGVAQLLAPRGRFVIEHPYAYLLRDEIQYDTIFHEHVSYPTVKSVAGLVARYGMKVVDVNFVDMNGGSMLVEVVRSDDPAPRADLGLIAFEDFIALNAPAGWVDFREKVHRQRASLRDLLAQLNAEGRTVVGYGAAAKCMTMLNYCGIDTRLVRAFGDANPLKQGLLCPGVRIPVVSPAELMAMQPDYVLIGAWNLRQEIVRQFRADLAYTGKFIVPLPEPRVID